MYFVSWHGDYSRFIFYTSFQDVEKAKRLVFFYFMISLSLQYF
jgi:hypothetical protein